MEKFSSLRGCDGILHVYGRAADEEAYLAEVEENAMIGGAGFPKPGEPHVH